MRAYFEEHPSEFADGKIASRSEGRRRKKGKRFKSSKTVTRPEVKEVKEIKVDSTVHRVLGSISNVIADGITAVIDLVRSPTASHLTLLCLIAMVFINIFIARKMTYVEQQLSNISQQRASMVDEIVEEAQAVPGAQQRREYNRQEEEDLWNWLGHIDPDKPSQVKEQVTYPSSDNPEEQEAIWDEAIRASKAAKERLDKHMIELSSMIQKAESNLEEVTRAVSEQSQKIKQE
jgi:hypothetical protein